LLDELGALHTDLSRFVQQAEDGVKVRERTIRERLSAYQALKGRAQTYADLLGMQQEQVAAKVSHLMAQAAAVLNLDLDDEDEADAPVPVTREMDAPVPVMVPTDALREVAVAA
jgi:hypothetical protein